MGIKRLKEVWQTATKKIRQKMTSSAESTSLNDAIEKGNKKAVISFLNKDPQVLIQPDKQGNLPLHIAARCGQVEIVHDMLKRLEEDHLESVSVNTKNRAGETLLHIAARHGHLQLVKELVKDGAEIATVDYERNTPLHLAALNGHEPVVSYLIDYLFKHFHSQTGGAGHYTELQKYVDVKNKAGNTPLHLAVLRNRKSCAYALMRCGNADIAIQNDEKETPLQLTDDALFQKDLTILSKTMDATEEGILVNKNVSPELEKYLQQLKQEKLQN